MKTQTLMALLIVGVSLTLVTSVSGCTRQGGKGGTGPGEITPPPEPPSGGEGVDVGDLDNLGLGDLEGGLDSEPNTEGIDNNLDLDL